jgi:hypothetical protein
MIDEVEPDQAGDDEIKGNHIIQQAGQNQDQQTRDERDNWRDVFGGYDHLDSPPAISALPPANEIAILEFPIKVPIAGMPWDKTVREMLDSATIVRA